MATDLLLDNSQQAWAYLGRVIDGPSQTVHGLLAHYSVEEIAYGIFHRQEWIGPLLERTASRYDWLRQQEDLDAATACGAKLVTPQSPQWPQLALDSAFGFAHAAPADAPATLVAEAYPPHVLWVRGADLAHLTQQAVAVVGTRAMSRYGKDATDEIAGGLARHHYTIVSGGAVGIDTAAHTAALTAGRETIAVMACGIDLAYPARNSRLFDSIVENGGAIITEFSPGTAPQRHRFLTRNRLTAALSDGTVIIEAAFRSGALNTANWAEALGKVVMAVPGPITSSGSLGCHQRIAEGRAQLVASVNEVRELLGQVGSVDASGQYELDFAATKVQRLGRNELKVYGSLPRVTEEPSGADAATIAREAALTVPLTIHILVALEQQGMVIRRGAQWLRVDEGA